MTKPLPVVPNAMSLFLCHVCPTKTAFLVSKKALFPLSRVQIQNPVKRYQILAVPRPHYTDPIYSQSQHFLYFLPLPHGQGSLRPTFFSAIFVFIGFNNISKALISSGSSGSNSIVYSQPLKSVPLPTQAGRNPANLPHRPNLFTFLHIPGVPPTNNHAEQSLRKLVIFRKVCFGTRSEKGLKTHSIIPSLMQTAKRQGVHPLTFLKTLLTTDAATAQAALYNNSS